MNACAHIADYWASRAKLYRSLSWFALWEIALFEARTYRNLAIGVIDE